MGRRELARGILAVCLGMWAVSFFLPAFDSYYWSENHHVSGFGAVGYSILMGIGGVAMLVMSSPRDVGHFAAVPVTLMIGTLWMANVLMVMAPFCFSLRSGEQPKGECLRGFFRCFPPNSAFFSWPHDEAIRASLGEAMSGRYRFFARRACFLRSG
jgi:hypothetical protein